MVTKRITRKKVTKVETKVEEKNLREYEIVFVVRPDIAEDKVVTIIDKVGHIITGKGGTISDTERWGKRKLAYPINHFGEGYYVLSRFKCEPAASKEIAANLQITEELLRFLVVNKA
jgi:small subunit ribosomal protein S6